MIITNTILFFHTFLATHATGSPVSHRHPHDTSYVTQDNIRPIIPVPLYMDDANALSSYLLGEWVTTDGMNEQHPILDRLHLPSLQERTTLKLNLTTHENIPTLNLNHIRGIETVDCITKASHSRISVSIRFRNASILHESIQSWPPKPKWHEDTMSSRFLILLGNHPSSKRSSSCLPIEKNKESTWIHALRVVTNWSVDPTSASVLVLDTVYLDETDIHPEYSVTLNIPLPEKEMKSRASPSLHSESLTKTREHNHGGFFKNNTWSFLFNHTDEVANTEEDGIYIGCNPCAMKGNLGIELKIQGSLFPSKQNNQRDIHLTVSGDLDTVFNWTVSMNAQYPRSRITPDINLFWIPLSPLQIPGLLHIGPSFAISVTAVLDMDRGNVKWNAGFQGRIPAFRANAFRFGNSSSSYSDSLGTKNVSETSSTNTSIAEVGFHTLPMHVSGIKFDTSLGFDIKSVFQLSFDIFGQTLFSAASAGIRFRYRSRAFNTPDSDLNAVMEPVSSPTCLTSKLSTNIIATIGPTEDIELGDPLFSKILYNSC